MTNPKLFRVGFLLAGSAGWTTRQLPRIQNGLLIVDGAAALFVYQFPDLEGFAVLLGVIVSIWLGNILLRAGFESPQT